MNDAAGGDFRAGAGGKLYWFDGKVWGDGTGQAVRLALGLGVEIRQAAAEEAEKGQRDAAWRWADKCESKKVADATVGIFSHLMEPVQPGQFDCEDHLLNVANGVVNLATGALLPNTRDHLFSRVSPVSFDLTATCPLWDEFILFSSVAGSEIPSN